MSFRGTISRRQMSLLGVNAGIAAWAGLATGRAAVTRYPQRTINFIIPYAAGGGFDSYGREFSALLQRQLHVNVEPVNMPGAAGAEAIFEVFHDRPDGYNISLINVPGILRSKSQAGFDVSKLTWLANLGRDPLGLAVSARSPIRSIADLQAFSKRHVLSMSSSGVASTDYFATKVLAASLGLRVHIVSGYKGSVNSLVAVARGDVNASVHSLSAIQRMEAAGLVRLIFTFEPKSEVPGVEDASAVGKPDLGEIYQYRTVVAPPGLSPQIASQLSGALLHAASTRNARNWAAKIRTVLHPLDQRQTLAMLDRQIAMIHKWQHVL